MSLNTSKRNHKKGRISNFLIPNNINLHAISLSSKDFDQYDNCFSLSDCLDTLHEENLIIRSINLNGSVSAVKKG